jgi:predicted aminopeptidase
MPLFLGRSSSYLFLMTRLAILSALFAFTLTGCATGVGYLAKQGSYLLRYSMGTRSVDGMIADPSTPPGTRSFLEKVREIKSFAVGTIGLRSNANYTRFKAIDRDHLVDVVSAAAADSFTPYLWTYPVLGRLPYKGFYERPDADAEAARLRGEGWDVIVRPVDAFSTLGFTKDPLYSFMERYSTYEIASLIIHEQTHATLFLKGQPDFNEELATFVGDEGAFEWMKTRFGLDSPEYRAAVDQAADQAAFIALLHDFSTTLAAMYAEPIPRQDKLDRKTRAIDEFNAGLLEKRSTLFRTDTYRRIGPLPLNNAYLSLYSLYSDDVPLLRSYWEQVCGSSLKRFIEQARTLAGRGDVKAQMRQALAAG